MFSLSIPPPLIPQPSTMQQPLESCVPSLRFASAPFSRPPAVIMLWLPVLLASHSSLGADDMAKATALTKPPRDSASSDATRLKLLPAYLQSEALVSEAAPAGSALSETCGAGCPLIQLSNGALTCCDAVWNSNSLDCATLTSDYYKWDCSGCSCPGDPSPPPSPPSPP